MAEEILGEGGDGEDTAASDSALTGSDEADAAKAATDEARELALAEDKATQTDDTSKDALSDEGKDGVPENYGDFILPEGVEMDKAALDKAVPVFKQHGFTQAQAQAMIDLRTEGVNDVLQSQQTAWADVQKQWRAEALNDPETGGAKYDQTVTDARKAIHQFGGPSLKAALDDTGMGNHPEFIKAFALMGKAIGEDNFSFGSPSGGPKKTLADRLYTHGAKDAA
jgi:hypothetical protein